MAPLKPRVYPDPTITSPRQRQSPTFIIYTECPEDLSNQLPSTSWVQVLLGEAPPKMALETEPLYYAASYGLMAIIKKLLDMGSAIDAPGGRAGATPLQVACFRNLKLIVKFLLEARADPNCKNRQGVSSIECAWLRNNKWIEDLLIQHGARVPQDPVYPNPRDTGSGQYTSSDYDIWARCCQCGGEIAWGTALYRVCQQCLHSKCDGCGKVSRLTSLGNLSQNSEKTI